MGLESSEARNFFIENNEASVYEEDIAFLKYDVQVKDISIKDLKNQLEEALKEKDDLKLKLEKFEESSKNLTKLINSQISAKDKVGLGYDSQMNKSEVVHSVFNNRESDVDNSPVNDRFKIDDSVYKTKVSETETSISKTSKDIVEKPKTVRPSAPIIEDWDTDSDNNSVFRPKTDQTKPKFTKINFVKSDENVKSVNKENTHKQVEYPRKSQSPRGNRRNWNGMMTQKLGNGFDWQPKSKVNDALPITYSSFKAHSPVRMDFNQKSAAKTNNFNEKVNIARVNNVTTTGPKAVVSAAVIYGENAIKSSAGWILRPTGNDQGIFDSGCSRHMIGNKSFLTNYQEVDGGFVAFAGSPKRGKITRKENNFPCFTKTECLVLSPDFKLLDESQVLLKVPRQNNMYSFDLKNVVPSGVTAGNQTNKNAVADDAGKKTNEEPANEGERNGQENFTNADDLLIDPLMPDLEDTANLLNTGIFSGAYDDEDVGAEADLNNLETTMNVSPISTTRIHKDHPKDQIIRDINSITQTGRMTKISKELAMMDVKSAFLYVTIEEEVYVCQPPGFKDPQFPDKIYKVEKALYGLHQASRAWYETLSTYLIKNGFRRGTIDKTLFIKKDKGDILLVQVYVDDIIFGSTKKSLCDEFEGLMHKRFQMSSMGELTFFLGLQVQQKKDGIFISQDKYVADILKKFDFATVKTASTPIESNKALIKDEEADSVDVHLYRSMIGSLMYLTTSRPDIMFVVCACARFQVTPKMSHLHAVKRIFRYLKGQPKLGLWYPRDSPFDLEAFSDSDYAGASLDRKSTTGGCQFLGKRLISWQCKKQTIVANSTTEAEYVAAANCCGQVLWIQNQMLDYGFNFMNTKIFIDNESTICIVKNLVFHSKTKHIEIRHHFIRDCYEKKLIQVIKIHTDHNVADLLTKAFDVSRFNFLIASIGLLNL
ncbi:putative ribonuclease H-like domain-containing protein [Tanacetum coccineum]